MRLEAVPVAVTAAVERSTVAEVFMSLSLNDTSAEANEASVKPLPAFNTISTWLITCFATMPTACFLGATLSVLPTSRSAALYADTVLWSAATSKGIALTLETVLR